jgi:hypothetical protein
MSLKGMAKNLEKEKSRKNKDQDKIEKLKTKIKKTIAEYNEQKKRHKRAKKYMSK